MATRSSILTCTIPWTEMLLADLMNEHLNSSTSCSVLHLYDSATWRRNQTRLTQPFTCFLRLQSIQRQAVQGQCCGFQNTPFAVLLCHPWSWDTEWLQSFRALCLPSRMEERMSTKPINIYVRKIASLPVQASHLLLKSHGDTYKMLYLLRKFLTLNAYIRKLEKCQIKI